jgi:hypothetical protein
MTFIADLWMPILLATVLVFVASAIIHMGPLWHRSDYPQLPDQDRLQDALRPFGLQPGEYMLPRPREMKDCNTPEFVEKLKRGPVLVMTVVRNGPMSMSKPLSQWFVYVLLVSVFCAYLAHATLPAGAPYLQVFRVAGTAAFLSYAVGLWQMSVWYHRPWGTSIKYTLDGLIFGCLTGGSFGWLWPAG